MRPKTAPPPTDTIARAAHPTRRRWSRAVLFLVASVVGLYLIGLLAEIAGRWLPGASASWPDALAYPQVLFAMPSWRSAVAAVALLLILVASITLALRQRSGNPRQIGTEAIPDIVGARHASPSLPHHPARPAPPFPVTPVAADLPSSLPAPAPVPPPTSPASTAASAERPPSANAEAPSMPPASSPAPVPPASSPAALPATTPTTIASPPMDSSPISDEAPATVPAQPAAPNVGARHASPGLPHHPGRPIVVPPPEQPSGEDTFAPRIFISHSSADNAFGIELARRLRESLGADAAVFYDRDAGLQGGDAWLKTLQYEIVACNVFVVVLSPPAFESPWVDQELSLALREAVSQPEKVIIPLVHQPTEVWPFLGNFQRVSFVFPRPYEEAFAELLDAVRLGHSRRAAHGQLLGARPGRPFDVDLLPLPARFIGRDADLEWALERLAPETTTATPPSLARERGQGVRSVAQLASIAAANGLAGIGKSALAGQLARILWATNRFPDGIAVVLCNDLTDPAAVLRRVLARFDPHSREPEETNPQALRDLVKSTFDGRHVLVVLDNVEANWPVEQVVAPLRVAGAAVLLTSRVRLPTAAVPPEECRMLELLSPQEAVDLFAEYVGRGRADDLTLAEWERVARIVGALGYHTLAVKLAAARAQGRDLAKVSEEYEADPRLGVHLREGSEAVDVVLASSVAALPEPAGRLFATLAAFATGDVGRAAVLDVAGSLIPRPPSLRKGRGSVDVPAPQESLQAILDLRLLDPYTLETLPEEADRERLRLHPLVRAYAEQLLALWNDEARAQALRAVATWYGEYASARAGFGSRSALVPDEANITDALEWAQSHGEDALLAALCWGLAQYWRDRGQTRAALRYLPLAIAAAERVARQTGSRADQGRERALVGAYGQILYGTGQLVQAEEALRHALDLTRALEDRQAEGVYLSDLGQIAQRRGRLDEAEGYFQQSLVIRREVQDRRGEGVVLAQLAVIAAAQGHDDEAEARYRQGLAALEETQDRINFAGVSVAFGEFLITERNQREEGCVMLAEAARLYDAVGVPGGDEARQTMRRLECGE
jgi:tetratricopeptide (TPR) repeat protein